nr:hypothetical protein [Rhodococcus sp. JVH1]EJI95567.1 hypothetical protein JVH1_7024 [Rhodococcus sp. JVH1]
MTPDHPAAPADPAIVVPLRGTHSLELSAEDARLDRDISDAMVTRLHQRLATGERVLLIATNAAGVIADVWPILGVSDPTTQGLRHFHLSKPAKADRALIGRQSPVRRSTTIEFWDPQHGVGDHRW